MNPIYLILSAIRKNRDTSVDALKSFVLLLFMLSVLIACQRSSTIATPPLSFPFFAEKPGENIEFEFRVTEKVGYTFSLCIYHKKNDLGDRERVRKLVGDSQVNQFGEFTNTGIPIPLKLRIVRQGSEIEQKIIDGVFSKHVNYASDNDGFYKKIVEVVLDPGNYKVDVEVLDNIHELAGTEVKFCLTRTHGK